VKLPSDGTRRDAAIRRERERREWPPAERERREWPPAERERREWPPAEREREERVAAR
jgi:hypothetical protein